MFLARVARELAQRSNAAWHTACAPLRASSSSAYGSRGSGAGAQWARRQLRDYNFADVRNKDCDQRYMSGWGPGGSKVNAAQNAVQLRHKPTGVTVKVHESRLLHQNVQIAFERLKLAVDRHYNKENCYEEQFARLQREREQKSKRARGKRRELRTAARADGDAPASTAAIAETNTTTSASTTISSPSSKPSS